MTRHRRLLWVIVGAALAVRVGFILWYPQVPVKGDAWAYEFEASQLASGTGTIMQRLTTVEIAKGPGYPMFLAAIYRLWGREASVVRVVQALMSACLVVLVALLAQAVVQQPSAALIAAALAAAYPPFISYPGSLLTETLSAFLLAAFIVLMMRAARPWAGMAAGVTAGLMMLTRSDLAVVVLVCAALAWRYLGARAAGRMAVVALMVVLPWTMRNAAVFHRFVPLSPEGGSVVWASRYEQDHEAWNDPRYQALVEGLPMLDTQATLLREGLKAIVAHPVAYLAVCMKRLPKVWLGSHSDTISGLGQGMSTYVRQGNGLKAGLKLMMAGYNLAVLVLGCLGGYLVWMLRLADPYRVLLIFLPLAGKAVVHFFLFSVLRHQVPVMPLLIVLAACAIEHARSVVGAVAPAQAS